MEKETTQVQFTHKSSQYINAKKRGLSPHYILPRDGIIVLNKFFLQAVLLVVQMVTDLIQKGENLLRCRYQGDRGPDCFVPGLAETKLEGCGKDLSPGSLIFLSSLFCSLDYRDTVLRSNLSGKLSEIFVGPNYTHSV